MDFDLPADDDPRRLAVREWLAANPHPNGRQLAEAGYVVPRWPRPWGLEADALHQLIIDEELSAAGVELPSNPIGIGWAAPTILVGGHRRAEATLLAADLQRRGSLVPALQRARRGFRSGEPRHPRRA